MRGFDKGEKLELGKGEFIRTYVSDDKKRLLMEFDVDPRGLSKTDVNVLIKALKQVREQMVR